MCKDKDLNFRYLKPNELQIKCTDTKYKGSATLLIFKDARVDMKVLDETCGRFGWQKDYKEIDGKVYCGVGILNTETNQYIWKWDTGTEGNFEAEKSEASDAFKRACFAWGLGRSLYNTPRVRIKCPDTYYQGDRLTMSFTVKSIAWDEQTDECVDLVIVDRNGHIVYDLQRGGTNLFNAQDNTGMRVPPAPQENYTIDNKASLIQFCKDRKAEIGESEQLNNFYRYYESKCSEWTKYKVDWLKKWSNWTTK